MTHFIFLITLLCLAGITISDENCGVPLGQCSSVMNLLRHRNELSQMDISQVFGYLKSVHCGFEGRDPLVRCPLAGILFVR